MQKRIGNYSYIEVIQEYYNYCFPKSKEKITSTDEFYKKTHRLIRKILRGFYSCAKSALSDEKLPEVPVYGYEKMYLLMILKEYHDKTDIYKLCKKIEKGKFTSITSDEKYYLLDKICCILEENIPIQYSENELDKSQWKSLVEEWYDQISDSIVAFENKKNFLKRFEKMWSEMYNECYFSGGNENIVTYCDYGNRCRMLAPDSIFSTNDSDFGQFAILDYSTRMEILDNLEERLAETLKSWKDYVEEQYIDSDDYYY